MNTEATTVKNITKADLAGARFYSRWETTIWNSELYVEYAELDGKLFRCIDDYRGEFVEITKFVIKPKQNSEKYYKVEQLGFNAGGDFIRVYEYHSGNCLDYTSHRDSQRAMEHYTTLGYEIIYPVK